MANERKMGERRSESGAGRPRTSQRNGSAQRRPQNRGRRRAQRRARIGLKIAGALMIAVLVLGIGGLGVWLLWERQPGTTITTYPVEYEALIRQYAAENDLEPAYVASVILAESSYRPEAVSSVNAQGLMQLLPSTGEWISGKFDETYAEGCLFDPDTNIRYGCWYLGFLMRRYDGDMRCASSAYHQGQGTVDQWLENPEYSADGKTLDTIPSDATRTYVSRILKYYEEYEKIYA